jgi:hypothetical protein
MVIICHKICYIPDVYLLETMNNTSNVCINDIFVPNCSSMLSNQNHKIIILRIFNALSSANKLIECDNEFIRSENNFVKERQFYDMHE